MNNLGRPGRQKVHDMPRSISRWRDSITLRISLFNSHLLRLVRASRVRQKGKRSRSRPSEKTCTERQKHLLICMEHLVHLHCSQPYYFISLSGYLLLLAHHAKLPSTSCPNDAISAAPSSRKEHHSQLTQSRTDPHRSYHSAMLYQSLGQRACANEASFTHEQMTYSHCHDYHAISLGSPFGSRWEELQLQTLQLREALDLVQCRLLLLCEPPVFSHPLLSICKQVFVHTRIYIYIYTYIHIYAYMPDSRFGAHAFSKKRAGSGPPQSQFGADLKAGSGPTYKLVPSPPKVQFPTRVLHKKKGISEEQCINKKKPESQIGHVIQQEVCFVKN